MEIEVAINPIAGGRFRGEYRGFDISAEGATQDEVIDRIRELVNERLAKGSKIVSIPLNPYSHPIMEFAGMFKDDPVADEWIEIMAERRRQIHECDGEP